MLANCVIAPGSVSLPAVPVSGMLAWYAADQITALSNGGTVATWDDLSGNGYTMTTQAGTPVWDTNQQNGLPAVFFTSAYMKATIPSLAQPLTVLAVLKATGGSRYFGSSGNVRLGNGTAADIYAGVSLQGGAIGTTFHVVTAQVNGASSLIRVDQTQTASGNAGTNNPGTAIALGSEGDVNQEWAGYLCELLAYPSALDSTDIATVETYLGSKWGLGTGGGTQQQPAGGLAAIQGAVGRAAVI